MGQDNIKMGFQKKGITLPLDSILPVKQFSPSILTGRKYAAIVASIKEIGLVEPPVVYPAKGNGSAKRYILLDGHLRMEALKGLGHTEVFCLISTDDEGYTYNHKVNRLATIQEHFMIMKAIDCGVSEERIAKALNVDVARIRKQRDLLAGICNEAVGLLQDKPISAGALRSLRKVMPLRQIEIADLMNSVGNYSSLYTYALIAATSPGQLTEVPQDKKAASIQPEDLARMQREIESLEQGIKGVEESYGTNTLNLVLGRGYIAKLLANNRVVRYLSSNHPDILAEFEKIVAAASLEA